MVHPISSEDARCGGALGLFLTSVMILVFLGSMRATVARCGELNGKPQAYVDVRKLLGDRSIDAISIATPMTRAKCNAGMLVWSDVTLFIDARKLGTLQTRVLRVLAEHGAHGAQQLEQRRRPR